MPILFPIILALVLVQYATRVSVFSRAALPNLLTSLGWSMTFPLLYAWTYNTGWYQSKICFDFVVGTAAFILLMSIESVLARLGHEKLSSLFMALINFACLSIPFIQWVYYCLFWHCLTPASLMALYLTNYNESIEETIVWLYLPKSKSFLISWIFSAAIATRITASAKRTLWKF